MNIVFMGNPMIANPILIALHESNHHILGVVSNAPKPMGRGRTLKHTAVGELATELNLNFIPADSLNDKSFQTKLKSLNPDLFVVVAFRILPKEILNIPTIGSVNIHTSLLPAYRGAAPIQHALLNGEKKTGITTFMIESKVDTGSILLQEKIKIDNEDDCGSLTDKMAVNGAALILKTLDYLEKGEVELKSQDNDLATAAPKISKEMCKIDWSVSSKIIHNKVRALSPFPGAYTMMMGKRLKIFRTKIMNENSTYFPGQISLLEKNRMAISCSDGQLEILVVHLEGKRKMDMADCLKGMHVTIGDPIG
ncbi:MAG: methionyl-tRNA formyltransferase [Candidatus Marinimicrobia bacterium]|nr:methionyl-tRNA formyltransferase [Candidatus Neomarinimicrobiota bacterium]MBL7030912.1 methionyl-tRNA formyltransferase [Candidatus Neomarinimicrobiota bacterium]